jgi:predicted enzyme related to lactoylglutathione lyase
MKNLLLVMLLAGAAGAETRPPQLGVSMITLGVTDTARSIKFYGETLGLQSAGEPEPGEVALFQAGSVTIVLNRPLGQTAKPIVGAVEVIFNVESVTNSYDRLVARGCRFVRTPREATTGTWAATFTDPDGHRLTILGPR